MIGDLALDAMEHHVRSFRMANTQHHESLQEVLRKYEVLVEDYRRLKSDYEEERDGRERYKKQARGHEKNPFALVLIDGDDYIFSNDLLSAGAQGGAQAAHLLRAKLTKIVAKIGQPEECEVLVRIYCNADGLFSALGEEAAQITPFMSAFNGAEPFFEFVDVYDGTSESASRKVEETFFLFAESTQCRHILFAGCHDARYMPLLSPHLGRSDRVTLLTAGKSASEYQSLGLSQVELGPIFRGGISVPIDDSLTIKGAANKRTQSSSSASRPTTTTVTPLAISSTAITSTTTSIAGDNFEPQQGICTRFMKKGTCKIGTKCKYAHPRRDSGGPEGNAAGDWGSAAPPSSVSDQKFATWSGARNPQSKLAKNLGPAKNQRKTAQAAFANDWSNNGSTTPAFADDWGAAATNSKPTFADGWDSAPSNAQPNFADDWGSAPSKPEASNQRANHSSDRSGSTRKGSASTSSWAQDWDSTPRAARSKPSMGLTTSSWTPQVNTIQFRPAGEEPPVNGAFNTAAHLPRPSPETDGLIPLNKDGCRLDFYLPRPSHIELQQYGDSISASGKKHCNEYQLRGECSNTTAGKECAYDHAPLKQEFFHILKYIVSAQPCSLGPACRIAQCLYGHVCQRPRCEGKGCRYKLEQHPFKLDLNAAKWVKPTSEDDDQPLLWQDEDMLELQSDLNATASGEREPQAADELNGANGNDGQGDGLDSDMEAPEKEVIVISAEDMTTKEDFDIGADDVDPGDDLIKLSENVEDVRKDPSPVDSLAPEVEADTSAAAAPPADFTDDWCQPSDAGAAAPPDFADDWGKADANAPPPDFADDWGDSSAAPQKINARNTARGGAERRRQSPPGPAWPSEIMKREKERQQRDYDHLRWVLDID
ncbi:hypothetical protein BKA80DRAFT_314074 [Phyllosticta citrichinensis]